MPRRLLPLAVPVALAGGILALALATSGSAASAPPAGARLDAYVDVAQRLYALEADGTVVRAAARRLGGRFVVASSTRMVPDSNGAVASASVQDVVGYVKLYHRLTGQAIVVHGAAGHAEARPVDLLHVPMPAEAGAVQIAGRTYAARTFAERGWGGEPLRVTVLVPTP